MTIAAWIVLAFSRRVLEAGLVKPSLVCTKQGAIKYFFCLISNFGSPFFLLMYFLEGGRFGVEDFFCKEYVDDNRLDLYILFTVQWINGKNVVDTFVAPYSSAKIVAHHIVVFMVVFSGICFEKVRLVSGVQASHIACMEFGSIFYCIHWYWPKPITCSFYYWLMSFSNCVAVLLLLYQQTLPCASTEFWPPYCWIFMFTSSLGLAYFRQEVAFKMTQSYGLFTMEERLMPSLIIRKDKKRPSGGPESSITHKKSE